MAMNDIAARAPIGYVSATHLAKAAAPANTTLRHAVTVWIGFFATLAAFAATIKTLAVAGAPAALVVLAVTFIPLIAVAVWEARESA